MKKAQRFLLGFPLVFFAADLTGFAGACGFAGGCDFAPLARRASFFGAGAALVLTTGFGCAFTTPFTCTLGAGFAGPLTV